MDLDQRIRSSRRDPSGRPSFPTTIRTVTPDSTIPEDDVLNPHEMLDDGLPIIASSVTASPRSISARDSPLASSANRTHPIRSSSDDRDITTARGYRDNFAASASGTAPSSPIAAANRPRTRTMDDAFVTSIGHPSITPAGSAQRAKLTHAYRERPIRTPPRRASEEQMRTPETTLDRDLELIRKPVSAESRKKLLYLMRSTCGRMEGMLAFRRGDLAPWSASYCSIDDETGSLVYEPKSDASHYRTLIPDLRGCDVKAGYDSEAQLPYLDVSPLNSNLVVHLRPHSSEEYEQWYAALLCWQPIRPKGIQNKMAKPQQPLNPSSSRPTLDGRRHSEISLHQMVKEAPIIKVGKMIFWDTNVSYSNQYHTLPTRSGARMKTYRLPGLASRRWRRVSCTLRENGEFKLYSENDVTVVSTVQLSQLSRCAVQRLDPSVLDNEFCVAIYPQYTSTTDAHPLLQPILLSLESRVLYEVWIVLLRAFTIPQLYGPKLPSPLPSPGLKPHTFPTDDMFRMERSMYVRVIEAKLLPPVSPSLPMPPTGSMSSRIQSPPSNQVHGTSHGGYYIEIQLDGETRARTMVKEDESNPFWREDFEFQDLPAVLSSASIVLRKRPPGRSAPSQRSPRDQTRMAPEPFESSDDQGSGGLNFDQFCGKSDIYLDDLEEGKEIEKYWPLHDPYGVTLGEVYVRMQAEERVILMAKDYAPLSEILHRFSNGLTLQIGQMLPGELKRLSECLLNIFQVSGMAADWIMSLVEEEIDGTVKETPVSRLRFTRRIGSTEAGESLTASNPSTNTGNNDREQLVREIGRSATVEANLLFRGNTLLTKSLDMHMKRLGREYLNDTIGEKIREMVARDLECEVDPSKVPSNQDLERNWRRLVVHTEDIWECISASANRCPTELRVIFRHIRGCAEDRYGDFLRTVKYSSVSGFLFLRFFCPAVLNPKLFGLLKDHPKPKTRRTLTLITKGLQGLANLSNFGSKETWMEPMNGFLNSRRNSFKAFIDAICSVPPNNAAAGNNLTLLTPSYSTPIQILGRLPPTSREGFPSLPYLIDHAKNFASLIDIWLDGTKNSAKNIQATDGDLLAFHQLCVSLQQRTNDCLTKAERAERPSSNLGWQWEELVNRLEGVKMSSQIDDAVNSDTVSVSSVATTATRASVRSNRTPTAQPRATPYQSNSTSSTPVSLPRTHQIGPLTPPEHSPTHNAPPMSMTNPLSDYTHYHDESANYLSGSSNMGSDSETTTALPPFQREYNKEEEEEMPDRDKHSGWYWGQSMKSYKKRTKEQERGRGKEKERER